MGLKKFLKKAKKTLKKVAKVAVAANPLIPGSKASKAVSLAAKKGLPIAVGMSGVGLLGGASKAAGGSNLLGGFGDVVQTIGGYADQAGQIIDSVQGALGYDQPGTVGGGGGPSGSDMGPSSGGQKSNMMPLVLIAAGVLAVVLLSRRN